MTESLDVPVLSKHSFTLRRPFDAPDFDFAGYDDEEELTEGVRYDLEEFEQILDAAQKALTRFYLAFD